MFRAERKFGLEISLITKLSKVSSETSSPKADGSCGDGVSSIARKAEIEDEGNEEKRQDKGLSLWVSSGQIIHEGKLHLGYG